MDLWGICVMVVSDGSKNERIEQVAVGGRVWGEWTVTGVALNWPFSQVIVVDATHQRVQVSGEGSVHSGESVRVTNTHVTGWGAVILPCIGGCFEERESGLSNRGGGRSGDAGDETALSDKSEIFPAGFRLKGCRVGHGHLEKARFAVGWEEGRVCGWCRTDVGRARW